MHTYRDQYAVLIVGETIVEYPQRFIPPETDELSRHIKPIGGAQTEAVVYSGKVTQIEDVVELGGCGREVTDYSGIQFQSHICYTIGELLDVYSQ